MHEWIKKNNEKVIYGLAILVVILLIWGFSTQSGLSQEVARLGSANSTLAAESAAKDNEIGEAKEKIDELSQDSEASKAEAEKLAAEMAALSAANGELSEKAASLESELSEAKLEIERLDFAALLRKNSVDNLTNEVTVLKGVETESGEIIAKLRGEADAAEARIKQLEETVKSLSESDN